MKVTIHEYQKRGERQWCVYHREGGKRQRQWFKSAKAAEAEAVRLRSHMTATGTAWLTLPPDERSALMDVWRKAKAQGIDLATAINRAQAEPHANGGPALGDVLKELLEAKRKAGRADAYLSNLELVLGWFVRGREREPIGDVTLKEVEAWLDKHRIESRSTLRARLSTLFRFGVRRGYCAASPCAGLEPVTVTRKRPQVFTTEQARDCLEWLRRNWPEARAWFILTAFCGLRPEEAQRTSPSEIHIAEGRVIIEAQTTKVRQRRNVYPLPAAIRLLRSALKGCHLPFSTSTRRRVEHGLRDHFGWKAWPKDITRHSAASYWLAHVRSAAQVAEQLGNSEKVLKRDYDGRVTREAARKYWTTV